MSGQFVRSFSAVYFHAVSRSSVNARTSSLFGICLVIQILGFAFVANGQGSDLTFNGVFDMNITTTQTAPVTLTSMAINLVLGLGEATAQLDARFSDSLFDTMTISATTPLGDINLNSSFRFNPSTIAFLSWQTSASFTLLDVAFSSLTNVVSSQTDSYMQLSVSGSTDDIAFKTTIKLGICPFEFWEGSACASWVLFDCLANMSACVLLDDATGFRNITASMTDYMLFEDVMGVTGSLSGTISYTTTEKLVSPSLNLTTDWFVCPEIEVLAEFDISSSDGFTVDGTLIYGIKGEIPFGPATFRFAESFSDSKNSSVTGKADYFEQLGLSVEIPGCCGPPGSLDFDAYFERIPSGSLFSWGLMTMSAEIHLTEGVSFVLDTQFANDAPKWAFSLSTKVFW